MKTEICQHGNDITNKMGIACPEGCLSNAQRGLENRQLVGSLNEARGEAYELQRQLNRANKALRDIIAHHESLNLSANRHRRHRSHSHTIKLAEHGLTPVEAD